MLVIKATGLVPVKAKVAIDNYAAGKIFGMKPEDARRAKKDGLVDFPPIPNDVEVEEVPGPSADTVEAAVKESDVEAIPIPEDWEGRHHLFHLNLAKKIIGGDIVLTDEQKAENVKTTDVAIAIIREELERRAAAETKPVEPAPAA